MTALGEQRPSTDAELAEARARATDAVLEAYAADVPFGRMAALDSALWAGIGYMRPIGEDRRDAHVARGVYEAWQQLGVTAWAPGLSSGPRP